jgi:hypothetical protein
MNFTSLTKRIDSLAERAPRGEPVRAFDLHVARLAGAADALVRLLPAQVLIALVDRIEAGTPTDADNTLLKAFDRFDLKATGGTAVGLVKRQAGLFRGCGFGHAGDGQDTAAIEAAAVTIKTLSVSLPRDLSVYPAPEAIAELGERLKGRPTPADIAMVRALPGQFLRSMATPADYAAFVSYRLWEF